MSDIKAEIERIKEQSLAAISTFRQAVDRDELRGRLADSSCSVLVNTNLIICYATPPFERMFGYESEQLEGKHISIVIPERFHESHAALTPAYVENPSRRKMSDRPDLRGLRHNGEEITVSIELRDIYFHGVAYFVAEVFEGVAIAKPE